jgi:hypothetical protein
MRDQRRRRANEILQLSTSPLLRHRSSCEDDVRVHPRRDGPGAHPPHYQVHTRGVPRARCPYRDDLVVAAECMFPWYWLADVCAGEGIDFVLGHALASSPKQRCSTFAMPQAGKNSSGTSKRSTGRERRCRFSPTRSDGRCFACCRAGRCSRWTNSARRNGTGSGRATRLTRATQDRARGDRTARVRHRASRAVDQEPDVRQPGAMMGRPLSASRRGPGCAAPPPSLAITDAHQRRHSS